MKNTLSINGQILKHNLSCEDGKYHGKAKYFNTWMDRLFELPLNLPKTCVRIEQIHPRALGMYNFDQNGIAVQHEITMNTLHLNNRHEWEILGTFVHKYTHFWEDLNGYKEEYKNSRKQFHSKYFIRKAAELRIPVNKWGQALGIKKDGPFQQMLLKYWADMTDIILYDDNNPAAEKRALAERIRLRPCKCSCTPPVTVWVGVEEFSATCGHCLAAFEKVEKI